VDKKKEFFFITRLFYSNKFYMELPAEEKIDLIVSQPISNFGKKKPEFSSFFY
jgi:hypothetical protein